MGAGAGLREWGEVGVVVALRDEEKKGGVKEVLRDEEEEEEGEGLKGEVMVRVEDEDSIVRGATGHLMSETRETSQLLAPQCKHLDPREMRTDKQ